MIFDFFNGVTPHVGNGWTLALAPFGFDTRSITQASWAHHTNLDDGTNTLAAKPLSGTDLWLFDVDIAGRTVLSATNVTADQYPGWNVYDPGWSGSDSLIVCNVRPPYQQGSWGIYVTSSSAPSFTLVAPDSNKVQSVYPDWNPKQ